MKFNEHLAVKKAKQLKLVRIIFIIGLLCLSTSSSGYTPLPYFKQTVLTISANGKTLKEVFSDIEKKSEFVFFFLDKTPDLNKVTTLSVKNKSIEETLNLLLRNTNLTYTIDNRQIIISSKSAKVDQQTKPSPKKAIQASGVVTDADGNPVVGATIYSQTTKQGGLTDLDGRYSVKTSVNDVLEFRYIGYNTEERKVKENVLVYNVRMVESSLNMDEVVVIGYGQQKKESMVASINSIGPSELTVKQRNLNNMIAGQVAGFIAVQRSGEPGNDSSAFYIRGQSSYMGGTSPLVLVDGVPRRMSDIDVDEIETFTVLKDAAATAVYGAEGANGVVLITSKRGKAQKTTISATAQYSIVQPTRMTNLMNSYDYLSLYNEAIWNKQGNPNKEHFIPAVSDETLANYKSGVDPDLYPNVNWMDLLSETTQSQRYTVNLRGGSDRTQFFASGSYYQEDGIFKSNPMEQYDANINLQRFNLRSNVDMTITKTTKLAVDISGQYTRRNTSGYGSDAIFGMISHFPTHLVPMYYSDGTASNHSSPDAGRRFNPYNMLNNSGYKKQWSAFIQSKVTLNQELDFITKGLSVKGSLSFDADFTSYTKRDKQAKTFIATGRDENGKLIKRTLNEGTSLGNPYGASPGGNKNIYIEGSFNYKRTFNEKHDVTGLLLYMQKETERQNDSGALKMLPYRKQSVVARVSYSYDTRYMLEGSFGATGSENFAEGHRWGIFPAVGAAWFISHERFMKPIEAYISKLKLRASYGITGNDNINDGTRFPYRESLNASAPGFSFGMTPGVGGGATNGGSGITESTFPMLGLTWEIEKKLNGGVDLGLFDGRVDLSVDFFSNRRSKILMQRKTISNVTGFIANPYQNYGVTTNKGFDGSLIVKQKIGQVNLSARGNFTFARNKIVEQDEVPQKYSFWESTGRSIGQPEMFIAEGLYTPDDFDITTDPKTGAQEYALKKGLPKPNVYVAPGDIKYKDLNRDNTIDAYDKTYDNPFYAGLPEIVYGFGINAEWKGIFVGIFFQGAGNTSANLLSSATNFIPFYEGRDNSSARSEAYDRWRADDPYNQNVLFPRMHDEKFNHNLEASTWWYRDASFLRLKNIEVGYDFNKKLIKKLNMANLRVFVQGSNIAVWDKIKYWDPELGGANSGAKYPICGTYTVGLEVTF